MHVVVKVEKSTKDFLVVLSYALFIAVSIFTPTEFGVNLGSGFFCLIFLLLSCFLNRGFPMKLTAPKVFAFLYAILLTYSTATSDIVSLSTKNFRNTIILIISFILICDIAPTKKQFDIIKRIWMYYAIVACLFAVGWAIASSGGVFSADRYSFVFIFWVKDVNYFVASILPAGYFALRNFIFREYGKSSAVDIVCAILVAVVVLMLQTRASFLAFIISALLLAFEYIIQTKFSLKKLATLCIGPLLCLVIVLLVLSNPAFTRLTDSGGYEDNVRLRVWDAAMKAYYDHPWVGSGLNSSNVYSYAKMELTTHNNFLDILGDSGIIGVILFGCLLLSMFKVGKKNLLNMLAMMVVFFVPMAFINGFHGIPFWLPMIFAVHQNRILQEEDKKLLNSQDRVGKSLQ